MRTTLILVLGLWGSASGQAPDSARIYRNARTAEAEYERALRRLAPLGTSGRSGTCDEYVGRFCLYYDTGRDTLPTEPLEIGRHRERAIASLEAAFALNAARTATAFPLIRLLLDAKRPHDALAIAHHFSTTSSDSITASALLALASHASAQIQDAERFIERWVLAVDSAERRRLESLRWLLSASEDKRYRALSHNEREVYERRFWRYADALYLTDGNETRTEHFARHAESRLVQAAPYVPGSTSWGSDVAELTIRFGTPKARTRAWPGGMNTAELHITEHWDPEQLIFAPPALDSVLALRPRPGMGWPMDTIRSISGHAPSTLRRMIPLEHQASIFRSPMGLVLRIDGVAVMDSTVDGNAAYRRGVFVLDGNLAELARKTDFASVAGDSLLVSFEIPVPPAAAFYSAEILETRSRLAARARFGIARPVPDNGLFLSDILIAEPYPPGGLPAGRTDPALKAAPSSILSPDQPFGIYAEVTLESPDTVQVELEMISIDGSRAVVRAARWLGEKLGLRDRPAPQRLQWSVEVSDPAAAPVALTVDPGNLKPGRYIVELAVAHDGRRVVSRREILFSASATNSRRP